MRDIVGLYLAPPDNALVLCIDEKTPIQALDRTQPLLPMPPGQVERRTHDYRRHGIPLCGPRREEREGARREQWPAEAFVWTKTAEEILTSVVRFCQRTSNSGP